MTIYRESKKCPNCANPEGLKDVKGIYNKQKCQYCGSEFISDDGLVSRNINVETESETYRDSSGSVVAVEIYDNVKIISKYLK